MLLCERGGVEAEGGRECLYLFIMRRRRQRKRHRQMRPQTIRPKRIPTGIAMALFWSSQARAVFTTNCSIDHLRDRVLV